MADTAGFVKGVKGSARQANFLKKTFKDSLSPLGTYNLRMKQLELLLKKGLITKGQHNRLAEKARIEHEKSAASIKRETTAVKAATAANRSHSSSISRITRERMKLDAQRRSNAFSKMPGNVGGAAGSLVGGARYGAAGRLAGLAAGFGGLSTGGAVGAATGVGIVISAAALAGKSATAFAEFETQLVDLQSVVGKWEGGMIVEQFRAIARESALTTKQLTDSAGKWVSYGHGIEGIVPIMKQIGTVAGGNSEKMMRLTEAIAQIQANGKLMGQEKNQLINAGFGLSEIAKVAGVDMSEFLDAMEAGKISSAHVLKALENMTSEGGMFANRLEDGANTLEGKWGVMMNDMNELMINIGEDLAPSLKYAFDLIGDDLKRLQYANEVWSQKGEGGREDNWINRRKDEWNAMLNGTSTEYEAQLRIKDVLDKQAKLLGFQTHEEKRLAEAAKERAESEAKLLDTMTEQQKAQQMLDRASLDYKNSRIMTTESIIKEIIEQEAENAASRNPGQVYFNGPKFLKDRLLAARKESELIKEKSRLSAAQAKRDRQDAIDSKVSSIKDRADAIKRSIKDAADARVAGVKQFTQTVQAQASQRSPEADLSKGGEDYRFIQVRQQARKEAIVQERLDRARNAKLEAIRQEARERQRKVDKKADQMIKAIQGRAV